MMKCENWSIYTYYTDYPAPFYPLMASALPNAAQLLILKGDFTNVPEQPLHWIIGRDLWECNVRY